LTALAGIEQDVIRNATIVECLLVAVLIFFFFQAARPLLSRWNMSLIAYLFFRWGGLFSSVWFAESFFRQRT
jgi:hypothetical protein